MQVTDIIETEIGANVIISDPDEDLIRDLMTQRVIGSVSYRSINGGCILILQEPKDVPIVRRWVENGFR